MEKLIYCALYAIIFRNEYYVVFMGFSENKQR